MGASPSCCGGSESAVSADKLNPDARVLRGQALFLQGNYDAALRELSAVIRQCPTHARAFFERGQVHNAKQRWQQALQDYSRALSIQPDYIAALCARARVHVQLKQYDDAVKDSKAATQLDPENAQLKALRLDIAKARAGSVQVPSTPDGKGGLGLIPIRTKREGSLTEDEEDVFAGIDTPQAVKAKKVCMVCMDAERACRLRPCMHAALCIDCANNLRAKGFGCPICGLKIESVEVGCFLKTYAAEEALGLATIASGLAPGSPTKSPAAAARGGRFGTTTGVLQPPHTPLPAVTEEDGDGAGTGLGSLQASVDLTGILPGQVQPSQEAQQEGQQEEASASNAEQQPQQPTDTMTSEGLAESQPAPHADTSDAQRSSHTISVSDANTAEEAGGQQGPAAAHEPGG